jgi:DASH complex subunit SPC19
LDWGSRESGERALRLKALKQKKERLGYAVERLTL